MKEDNNEDIDVAEISSMVFGNPKDGNYVSKDNDFAICIDTEDMEIQITLGQGTKKILSTIQKKLKAGEFVVKKNDDKNEDELYFVFFKKRFCRTNQQ